jgi:hypothetical protein
MDYEKWAYPVGDEELVEATAEAAAATDEAAEGDAEGDNEPDYDADTEPDDHADDVEGGGTTRWMMAVVRNEDTAGQFMVGVRIGPADDDRGVLMSPEQAVKTARELVSLSQACKVGNSILDIFNAAGMNVPDDDEDTPLSDEDTAKLERIAATFGGSASRLQD